MATLDSSAVITIAELDEAVYSDINDNSKTLIETENGTKALPVSLLAEYAGARMDLQNTSVTFEEQEGEIESGSTIPTLFGRIKNKISAIENIFKAKILTTYEGIMNNTNQGYIPDAIATKEGFEYIGDKINNYMLLAGGTWSGASADTYVSLSKDGAITKVPLTNTISSIGRPTEIGDPFTFVDDGIEVLEDGIYMVSASAYIIGEPLGKAPATTVNSGYRRGVCICKNGTEEELTSVLECSTSIYQGTTGGVSVSPKIVSLKAGDIIYLCGRSITCNAKLYTGNSATYLTIIKLPSFID